MADVDMTDAPVPKAKTSKAPAEGSSDGKKRFEVKKVGFQHSRYGLNYLANLCLVECRCSLGLGHCRR